MKSITGHQTFFCVVISHVLVYIIEMVEHNFRFCRSSFKWSCTQRVWHFIWFSNENLSYNSAVGKDVFLQTGHHLMKSDQTVVKKSDWTAVKMSDWTVVKKSDWTAVCQSDHGVSTLRNSSSRLETRQQHVWLWQKLTIIVNCYYVACCTPSQLDGIDLIWSCLIVWVNHSACLALHTVCLRQKLRKHKVWVPQLAMPFLLSRHDTENGYTHNPNPYSLLHLLCSLCLQQMGKAESLMGSCSWRLQIILNNPPVCTCASFETWPC